MRISGINIQDMEAPLTITGEASKDETTQPVEVEVTPLGYVYYALNNSNSSAVKKTAMAALYLYWNSANTYAG
jgi:hypothetical protein